MSDEDAQPATDAPQAKTAKPAGDFVPPIILRNRGVPITLYRLEDGRLPEPPDDLDDDDEWEPKTRKLYLRFNANHIAEIEEAFDGLVADQVIQTDEGEVREQRVYYGTEAFQKALDVKQNATLRRVLAIALETDENAMGLAMIPDRMLDYNNAVGVAWSISQGVDPSEAARMLQKANAAVAAHRASLASQLDEMMDVDEE